MYGQMALDAYSNTKAHSSVVDASPHKLITLLFESAQTRLVQAMAAAKQNDLAKRGELVGKVIDIVSNLQADLDMDKGGEVANNLDALYDYMARRLLEANRANDVAMLKEVHDLLGEIRSGWEQISPDKSV